MEAPLSTNSKLTLYGINMLNWESRSCL